MPKEISTIEQLESWLRRTPVMLNLSEPLTLVFLSENPRIFDRCIDMVSWLERPEPIEEEMLICLSHDTRYTHRFPYLNCVHSPYTSELDKVLLEKFHQVQQQMASQKEIGNIIVNDCRRNEIETVVLILIDGLSYANIKDWTNFSNKRACLVPGITTTSEGFTNVIGNPPLAGRLFELGFRNRLGYTYWTRERNELTDQLFRTIPSDSIIEGNTMSETLKELAKIDLSQTFVQIVRVGLDQYAHSERGEDLEDKRKTTLQNIRRELLKLAEILESKGQSALIYLTSDHGLLWRDQTQFEIVGNAHGKSSPRYCPIDEIDNLGRKKGRVVEMADGAYFQLGSNYLRRKLYRNEFGVHGGLSYAESVIPLIRVQIRTRGNLDRS